MADVRPVLEFGEGGGESPAAHYDKKEKFYGQKQFFIPAPFYIIPSRLYADLFIHLVILAKSQRAK